MSRDRVAEHNRRIWDPDAEAGSDEHLESIFPAFVEVRARKARAGGPGKPSPKY